MGDDGKKAHEIISIIMITVPLKEEASVWSVKMRNMSIENFLRVENFFVAFEVVLVKRDAADGML